MVSLNEKAISAAVEKARREGKRIEVTDSACQGLRLRVTAAGQKAFFLICRDQRGGMRSFKLGDYPAMPVREAREAVMALRMKIRNEGADPVAERRRERAIGIAAREGIGTLQALIDLYGQQKGAALASWPEAKRRMESVFKPFLGHVLADLRAGDLQLRADAYPAKQSASAAVRYLRPILRWAAAPGRGYVPADLGALQCPATPKRRDRVLTRSELAAILPALEASDRPHAAALRFMLLTLARREEVCSARWQHIDMAAATWTLPKTKNKQPHVVPLSRQAVALLQARLPAEGTAEPGALVFCTSKGGPVQNWDREAKRLQEKTDTANWTRHDLRRTGATMLGDLGVMPDIIEAALNHTSIRSALAATYNRSRYRPAVAAALQTLADALDGITTGGAEVVPLVRMT
ncbi:site-specific integrase [Roseomonas sp. GC11]|uniref:tyrosine-type recombinase/integrase n=1 Tax=Roseomonas sp. GC11 TaxID=2950546 RepID=UPI00210A9FF2|nr:site-specific integrase [Roseomonas sp. GC11]MCQ4158810.1 site-specific integrase [Roseomonas sp. GC11]